MEEILTAPTEVGNANEIAPQDSQPQAQAPAETQSSVVPQVEANVNPPQAVETQRPKVSSFYKERERVRRIEENSQRQAQELAEMRRLYQELKNPKPDVSNIQKLTAEELLNDPEKVFQSREQRLLQEFNSLKEELNQLKSKEVNAERTKLEREALEVLFPKSSPDSKETLEERIKNQERADLIQQVLRENPSLDRFSSIDPKAAAEFLLEKINKIKPQSSPNVIPKALMGSTARGNPGAGKVSFENLMSDYKKLTAEIDRNPALRFDAKHKERRESLMRQMDSLAKE